MKLIVIFIISFMFFNPVQSQEITSFGELQDSTSLTIENLLAIDMSNGVIETKSGKDTILFSYYQVSNLGKKLSLKNKSLVNISNFNYILSIENTGWDNINSYIYDSVQNLIYLDSNKYYQYSLTPTGKFLFTSSSIEENYLYIYDNLKNKKIKLDNFTVSPIWKAVAPNDSLILVCDDFDFFHLDLISGDIFNTLTKRYSNKKIHELNLFPPYFYTSDDGMDILLNWSDSLYLFDTNGDIRWKKGGFTITHHIAISSKLNIAFILLSNHNQVSCQLIDLESANILDTIIIPSKTHSQYWKTQCVDNCFIFQPNGLENSRLTNFSDSCKTYVFKYDLVKKTMLLQETLKGNVFFAKNNNGIRSFLTNPNNTNEIIIKDWVQ